MKFNEWLFKKFRWLKPIPEPFKTIIFLPFVILICLALPFLSTYFYIKRRIDE